MGISNAELLRKATGLQLSDFGGGAGQGINNLGEAPFSIEQVETFIRLMVTPQAILPDVRTVTSAAPKWQESVIDFSARVMKPGVEMTELGDPDKTKPTTGIIEINTVLIRGQVPMSDEVLEDQVERAGFSDTVTAMMTAAAGRDIEDLMLNGDADNSVVGHDGSAYMMQGIGRGSVGGWLKQAATTNGGHVYDAVNDGQDYQLLFNKLLTMLPDKYKRDKANWRYYVPQRLEEKYREQLAARATGLGDAMISGGAPLRYQEIPIFAVPLMQVKSGAPDTSFILLTHRSNLYAGFHRSLRFETFRYPPSGTTNFLMNARVDAEIGNIDATVIAKNVDVEP